MLENITKQLKIKAAVDPTTALIVKAQSHSVQHSAFGSLYGPFYYSTDIANDQVLKHNCIELQRECDVVLAYYPNLLQPGSVDLPLTLDILTRTDFSSPKLIFYTDLKPSISHWQLEGIEVFWPQEELKKNKLGINAVIMNEFGSVSIGDQELFNDFKAKLIKYINALPLKKLAFYNKYLELVVGSIHQ